jgi:hypothetical protein
MSRRLAIVAALALVVGATAATPTSLAVFTSSRASTATFGTATIAPPTALSGTGGATATLHWTASTTGAATGYKVYRTATSGSGYAQVGTVTPVSAVTTTDGPANGTWYYVLQTYLGTWASVSSNEASVLVGPAWTGWKGCTANAPETTGSGDNNGYETNPGNACALDGLVATDASSGRTANLACANTGQDRHKFWGYAFGLPGSVTAVNGITLDLVAGLNAFTGTNIICAQVSWDGGTTWSAYEQVSLVSATLTTYSLGGAADTWGHAGWTPGQLGTSTFRVRITDVSSVGSRAFNLDDVGASVTYTP